jgi:hypothetical protein
MKPKAKRRQLQRGRYRMTQKITSKQKIKKVNFASIYPTCPFDITVSSIESTTIDKNNASSFFIYLDIRNISEKRIKVEFPFSSYVTKKGLEFNQDYWLTRFANGAEGISIKSGAYKQAGLIYCKDKLNKISIGDELTIDATVSPQNVKYIITLRCESIDPYIFNPIPVEQEELPQAETKLVINPSAPGNENDGQKREITSIIERLELIEEKMGISLGGIYATIEKSSWKDKHFELCINFDILSSSGDPLENSFSIQGVAYNESGQSLGIGKQYIDCHNFFGLASESITITADQVPAKIRLYPVR